MLTSLEAAGAEAPFGGLLAARTELGVCFLAPGPDLGAARAQLHDRLPAAEVRRDDADPLLLRTLDAVRRYVELADPHAFDSIPVDLCAGTDFQSRVWSALREIPHGETRTYGNIAEVIGMTKAASRAVGAACGANPIALLVPCHRAVGASGELVGFAWGGVDNKRMLLDLESRDAGLFAPPTR